MAKPKEEENHAYDDAGMPLGTVYIDYDNAEERKQNMVKDKVIKHPVNEVYDTEYQGEQLSKEYTGVVPLSAKDFNSSISEGVMPEIPEVADTAVIDYKEQGRGGTDEYFRKLNGDDSEVTTPFNPESIDTSFLDGHEDKKEDTPDA